MRIFIFVTLLLSLRLISYGQDLPRRVYLGIKMGNLTDQIRLNLGIENIEGVIINEVFPGSTAAEAKFEKGDILVSLDNNQINSIQELLALLVSKSGGDKFDYELYRNKEKIKGSSVFKTYPKENYAGLDVLYVDSKSSIGIQRTIITKPLKAGKLPLIVFIGGIGCYSLDFPLDTTRSEVQLLNRLSRAGFLCARLEKPGMGDSGKYCKPCNEVSFLEETEGYVEAIKKLKLRPDVDSNSVYVFGHSMGGVFGPLVAHKTSINGIIAFGTLGSNFIEYLAKSRRTIAEAYKMNPEETDDYIKNFCECSAYYFIDKLTTREATIKNPVCQEMLSLFDLRSRKYNDELYNFNYPGLWKEFNGKALLIWGESDYVSSKEDHKIIADAINYYHNGNAEFLTIKSTDHGMNQAIDYNQAHNNPGPYNEKVGSMILDWLKRKNKV